MARKKKVAAEERTFKVLDAKGQVVGEGASPIVITGLKPESTYNYTAVAIEDGKESESVKVPTINTKASNVAVTGVDLKPDTASVVVGATTQLTATVQPDNATNKAVTYKSSDETKATVDDKGVVTGVSAGTADITVTTADGNKTDKTAVTVTAE